MDSARWAEVRRTFEELCELDGPERGARLARLDGEVRAEVERLLGLDGEDSGLLEPLRAEAPVEGERIGAFVLVRRIASGGMGAVYEAHQEHPSRRVALKVLHPELGDPRSLRRFEDEAEALGRLSHPAIAKVHAAGVHEGGAPLAPRVPWIALELVEGARTLTAAAEEDELDTRQRLLLFAQVCDAVHHGHQRGVVHRDLKPGNVLIDGEGRPKVIDFGIAKALDAGDDAVPRTLAGEVLGTLQYMSPEQVAGDPDEVDARCDVFALGALLFELLAGRAHRELGDLPLPEALERVREGGTQSLPAGLSRELDWIARRAMEPEPERRYGSAAQLAADVRRHLDHEPIEAGPPSAAYRIRKLVRRHWIGVGASAAVLSAIVVGLGFALAVQAAGRRAVLQMADVSRLDDYLAEAERLGPPHPDRVDELRDWLARAEELAARSDLHRRTLAELETERDDEGFPSYELAWHHGALADLLPRLEALAAPGGPMDAVRARLARATEIRARTLEEPSAAWERARAEIADADTCPRYRGLEIAPQLGLIPLRRDPATGLWEFLHWLSGAPPAIDDEGQYRVLSETGAILVLLPGDTFEMGASELDDRAREDERPRHEVSLAPFFVAKYELTQAQWLRLTGANPSFYDREETGELFERIEVHPVESVDWYECERELFLAGLSMPTEAQWEYAARAGTDSAWSCADFPEDVFHYANAADRRAADAFEEIAKDVEEWVLLDDGWAIHAPVGCFRPNPFGLHDVHGNVFEWCRDSLASYAVPARGPDGFRPGGDPSARVIRGGSWNHGISLARSAARHEERAANRVARVGIRPVRPLEP